MRLIDADALLKTFEEKGIRYSVDVHNAIIDAKTPVAFICDGRACPQACMECQHTTDITHADSFINKNGQTHKEEMEVLDDFLFRCWQMGWLDRYEKHGRWIDGADGSAFCSECGTEWLSESVKYYKFCPICGARMEVEE